MSILQDRIALVAGSSTDAGTVIATELAGQGSAVAVHGREGTVIGDLAARIQASGGRSIAVTGGITLHTAAETVRRQVESSLGQIDILVVDAGDILAPVLPLEEIPDDSWRTAIDASLLSTFLILKTFLPGMKQRGRGAIITIAPTVNRSSDELAPLAYGAAAAAIARLTQDVAIQAGPFGVRANCIAPQLKDAQAIAQPAETRYLPYIPIGAPADVASAAVFLASDAASLITGQVFDLTGALRVNTEG